MRRPLATLLCTLLLALPLSAVADTLDASWPLDKRIKPGALFNHDDHNEAADLEENCGLCHHSFDDEGNLLEDESSEDSSCAECHSVSAEKKKTPLRAAFHARCRSCHEDEKRGPVTCGGCHIKEGKNP